MNARRASTLAARAVALLLLVLGSWAFWFGPRRLVVRRATVPVAGLAKPLRVALLSDVHSGAPHMPLERVARIAEAVNAEKPDAVFLLGDYVIHGVMGGVFVEPEGTAKALSALRAPLGVYAVLGNHDWWYDGERVRRAFEAAQIPVLENSGRPLGPDRSVWVAGLADKWTRRVDVASALRGAPERATVLLLAHNPDSFPDVPRRVALMLAGHTHGGQVRLPFIGAPLVPSRFGQRYASGLVVEDGRRLFVTTGLGTSVFPVRFRVPPEIALLDLRP